ncbi:MAG TPA: GTPase Era [Gemmatimonadaceae bacterium]|nr:GTPase Era [Gemmatimonadaceae bacterium]
MKSGFVALAGAPNVGKSTLLNRLVGERLAITSAKAQSTRTRVEGVRTAGETQMVFVDTPGLLDPDYPLQAAMRSTAVRAIRDADVVVHLADARDGMPRPLAEAAGLENAPRAPVIVALNKTDALTPAAREALARDQPEALLISARTGEGVEALLARVAAALPEGPFLYGADDLATQQMRFFATEFVREAVFEQLEEELPYAVACEIEEFRESASPVYIRAVLYVEREGQKGIVIGRGGARIRAIGTAARARIEALAGGSVFLDLHVKVLPHWRRDAAALRRFGYAMPEE